MLKKFFQTHSYNEIFQVETWYFNTTLVAQTGLNLCILQLFIPSFNKCLLSGYNIKVSSLANKEILWEI